MTQAQVDHRVSKVTLDSREPQDNRAQQVLQDNKARLVILDYKVPLGKQEILVSQEAKVQ